jgi:phage shock protein E
MKRPFKAVFVVILWGTGASMGGSALAAHSESVGFRNAYPANWVATRLTPMGESQQAFQNVGVEQFDKLRADKANTVLDVRTKKEFDAGHVPGAVHLDIKADEFAERAAKLDKSGTYLVYCAVGGRSVAACNKLSSLGFTHLFNLERGYNAWAKSGSGPKN